MLSWFPSTTLIIVRQGPQGVDEVYVSYTL